MKRAQIGVLEYSSHESLCSFLKAQQCSALEAKIIVASLSDFSHKSLERLLRQKKISALLKLPNLSQGKASRSEAIDVLLFLFATDCFDSHLRR